MSLIISKLPVSILKNGNMVNIFQCLSHIKEKRRTYAIVSEGCEPQENKCGSGSHFWSHIKMGPDDPILALNDAFKKDHSKVKVNLGVGAYRDEEGKPLILPSVSMAKEILYKKGLNHEYGPIGGDPEFCELAAKLALGEGSCVFKEKSYCTIQTISGTGALRIGFEFLGLHYINHKEIFISDPTWSNHYAIADASYLPWFSYKYYNPIKKNFEFQCAMDDMCTIPRGSIILFHECAHNPTGVDPTKEQWQEISEVAKARNLLPFFDMAYQGFASGDMDEDAYALRHFIECGHQVMIAQSFSKNMGLYGERIGALTICCGDPVVAAKVHSRLKLAARAMYSVPPLYGQRIVTTVLSKPDLKQQWFCDVQCMAKRVIKMRKLLRENLEKAGSKLDWNHITDQIGMFCYTGLSPDQVDSMTKDYHIYMTKMGRICIAGITTKNVKYVADAMHKVTSKSIGSHFWSHIKMGPDDPILALNDAFKKDHSKVKVNLGVGAYRDEEGKPLILPSVSMAKEILYKKGLNHEYGPIGGDPEFCELAAKLALGEGSCVFKEKSYCTIQTISGTGALRIGFEFLGLHYINHKEIFISDPTWSNHYAIADASYLPWFSYKYYNPIKKNFEFQCAMDDMCTIPRGSIILFHECAHNPTGVDPTKEQWQEISEVAKARNLLPFFDMAYQGFASGDMDEDAYALRHFIECGHQVMIAQSFSKNMGLYGERIGALTICCGDPVVAAKVHSRLKLAARAMYSVPPLYGQRIVTTVLSKPDLKQQWFCDVQCMAKRVIKMRKLLRENLEKAGSKLDWNHITDQIGMFCYTGLSPDQVDSMTKDYHIYMTKMGRICIAGITTKNVKYVADAMHKVTSKSIETNELQTDRPPPARAFSSLYYYYTKKYKN